MRTFYWLKPAQINCPVGKEGGLYSIIQFYTLTSLKFTRSLGMVHELHNTWQHHQIQSLGLHVLYVLHGYRIEVCDEVDD